MLPECCYEARSCTGIFHSLVFIHMREIIKGDERRNLFRIPPR